MIGSPSECCNAQIAQSFAPAAFEDYLQTDEANITRAIRLPAESDPMMARITTINKGTMYSSIRFKAITIISPAVWRALQ